MRECVWFHEKIYDKKREAEPFAKPPLGIDLTQSIDWQQKRDQEAMTQALPCCLQSSCVWLFRQRRLATGRELMALQGFPFAKHRPMDFRDGLGPRPLKYRERVQLAGNAFNAFKIPSIFSGMIAYFNWGQIFALMSGDADAEEDMRAQCADEEDVEEDENADESDLEADTD